MPDETEAMKDQLRKDVASWSAARSGNAADAPERIAVPTAKPVARARPAKAKIVLAATAVKQPFRMSYDGTTDRDYIAHRIKLGAR